MIALAQKSDSENRVLAASQQKVEELLGDFYGRYPWPWRPMKFEYLEDPFLETALLNQGVGDWSCRRIPQQASIWVAGCGTNQAVQTALRFPRSQVRGSDLSVQSLQLTQQTADELGITNLQVRRESINRAGYRSCFDYIISTGVIHHNADPAETLAAIADALKPEGILELMVYNRHHRALTTAFQKAIRIFGEQRGSIDFEADMALAQRLMRSFPQGNLMADFLCQLREKPENDIADLLINPVEHSYTIESLQDLAERCGLEMLLPCLTPYSRFRSRSLSWNMRFEDPRLQEQYNALPDLCRWQVSNLLLHDASPQTWLYFQRKDSGLPRKAERQVCQEFLGATFEKVGTLQRSFIRQGDGASYQLSPRSVRYPAAPPEDSVRDIYDLVDGRTVMLDIFERLAIEPDFDRVNQAYIRLTNSAFPYLKAITREQ